MHHYFDNFTSTKNANYIAEKAQPPEKVHAKRKYHHRQQTCVQKCTTGFISPKQTWPTALANNYEFQLSGNQIFMILKKKLTDQIRAISRPSYEYLCRHCLEALEFNNLT